MATIKESIRRTGKIELSEVEPEGIAILCRPGFAFEPDEREDTARHFRICPTWTNALAWARAAEPCRCGRCTPQ